jgi:hypothetical protein
MNDTDTSLRETIVAWLRDQGHQAVVDVQDERYAEVVFRTRGRRFAVRVDEDDPAFLYIIASMVLPDDVIDELQARRAAALTESRNKVVQVENPLGTAHARARCRAARHRAGRPVNLLENGVVSRRERLPDAASVRRGSRPRRSEPLHRAARSGTCG